MKLYLDKDIFETLCALAASHFHISSVNIKRDYYLVMMLNNLANSEYVDKCVFKGGTSLSKCYSNVIRRFSEDIDLTLLPNPTYKDKQYDKALKDIESIMTQGFSIEKIIEERNSRNKSCWVWNKSENKESTKVKLEIGSRVIPYPFKKREIRSYIYEYLVFKNMLDDVNKYELKPFYLNVLDIERTFIDKIMAIKRHAICNTLNRKVRHIYDVCAMYKTKEIQSLFNNVNLLKSIVRKTKETDSFYLTKRKISTKYNPNESYNFDSWKKYLDNSVKSNYKSLKDIILDENIGLNFVNALKVLEEISNRLKEIDE